MKMPTGKALAEAHKMGEELFRRLKLGENEQIAKWLVAEIGYAWDATTKIENMNEFKAKLDIIQVSPPASSYGALSGFDLIEESYLPGSDRYFRTTYISYHEGAPLIWELRFYVKPDGRIALNYITWSEKNPFEYLSTAAMQVERWYKK
jgi:hypothetical protein